jgi:hypothetical protein
LNRLDAVQRAISWHDLSELLEKFLGQQSALLDRAEPGDQSAFDDEQREAAGTLLSLVGNTEDVGFENRAGTGGAGLGTACDAGGDDGMGRMGGDGIRRLSSQHRIPCGHKDGLMVDGIPAHVASLGSAAATCKKRIRSVGGDSSMRRAATVVGANYVQGMHPMTGMDQSLRLQGQQQQQPLLLQPNGHTLSGCHQVGDGGLGFNGLQDKHAFVPVACAQQMPYTASGERNQTRLKDDEEWEIMVLRRLKQRHEEGLITENVYSDLQRAVFGKFFSDSTTDGL